MILESATVVIVSDFGASVPMIPLLVGRTVVFAFVIALVVVDLVAVLDVVIVTLSLREVLLVAG